MTIDKAALRQSARELRDSLTTQQPKAGEEIANVFPMKLLERFGPDVAGYIAIGSELDPAPLMGKLRAAGAKLSLPRVEADDSMTFRRFDSVDNLEAGPFGLLQPSGDAEETLPTLILTPMLAFDAAGNRLGYGKGHYDRALARLREAGRAFVCGLAFAEQEVIGIPAEATDIPLDWVVTPERSLPLFFGRMAKS